MSKEADAIILIGSAYDMASQVPPTTRIRLGKYMLNMRNRYGDHLQPDGRCVDVDYFNNMYAGEALMQLGSLATNRFLGGLPPEELWANHYREGALNILGDIDPFAEEIDEDMMDRTMAMPKGGHGSPFSKSLQGGPVAVPPNAHDGIGYAREALSQLTDRMDSSDLKLELNRKTAAAMQFLRRHGTVLVQNPLVDLGSEMLERVKPEKVHLSEDSTGRIYDLGDVAETTGVDLRPRRVPYYASLNETNGKELFSNALEDLYEISHALKTIERDAS